MIVIPAVTGRKVLDYWLACACPVRRPPQFRLPIPSDCRACLPVLAEVSLRFLLHIYSTATPATLLRYGEPPPSRSWPSRPRWMGPEGYRTTILGGSLSPVLMDLLTACVDAANGFLAGLQASRIVFPETGFK